MTVDGDGDPREIASQTRGFLFADIRGYTEFVERHGASAASELLQRYRSIVRDAIASHAGAEVRTEGDSFYVVLPSASAGVRCALAIVARVAAENRTHPEDPIRVGIGVHAGEAIETDEGLIGSAVNIAARLSAMARPGEVLVSETVRTLTRSIVSASFTSRGRHRLKGVAEPQEVFAAAESNGTALATRSPRLRARLPVSVLFVALALLVIVPVAYLSVNRPLGPASPSAPAAAVTGPPTPSLPSATIATPTELSSASASAGPPGPSVISIPPNMDPGSGVRALAPGRYRFSSFQPNLAFEIEGAWTDRAWHPLLSLSDRALLVLTPSGRDCCGYPLLEGLDRGVMLTEFARVQTVLGNPCDPGDTSSAELLGGDPKDWVEWLTHHQFLKTTDLRPIGVGGWSGLSVDVTVTGDPGEGCGGVPGRGSVYLFRTSQSGDIPGTLFRFRDGDEARFEILDVGDDAALVLISMSGLADFSLEALWSEELIATIVREQ